MIIMGFHGSQFFVSNRFSQWSPIICGKLHWPQLWQKCLQFIWCKDIWSTQFQHLCWLFGCCLSHKCFQMPLACMSPCTLIMSFWPNMVWTTFSQMFFSICITSKMWQIYECCHLQDSPIIIHPHNNNLCTFQSNDNKT
jgi:hypothetical protein